MNVMVPLVTFAVIVTEGSASAGSLETYVSNQPSIGTNQSLPTYELSSDLFQAPQASQSVREVFETNWTWRASQIFGDSFTSPAAHANFVEWMSMRNESRTFSFLGQNAAKNAFLDSARETAVAVLPIDVWEDRTTSLLDRFGAGAFAGSLGNTVEERVTTVSASSSYADNAEKLSLSYDRNGVVWYGVRPLRSTPYVYAATALGHADNHPLLILDIRSGIDLEPDRFGRFFNQAEVTLPLPRDCDLALGASLSPNSRDADDRRVSWSIRFEHSVCLRELISGRNPLIGYVGVSSFPEHGVLCAFGFQKGW